MLIQPHLLKAQALEVNTKVFVCGPGYGSDQIDIRNLAKKALQEIRRVEVVYGEELESKVTYKKQSTDLQTLEVRFAHDVDFTLLILESPGSIAELGTFTQFPEVRGRLVVLISSKFYRAESYISRGPLSLLSAKNPNSVIYFDPQNTKDMLKRVLFPLTFYKFAHYTLGYQYLYNTRISHTKIVMEYEKYIAETRKIYQKSVVLVSVLLGDRPSYSELLLMSGLAPKQLNASLHELFNEKRIERFGSGKYKSLNGYSDKLLEPFNTTAISVARSKFLSAA